MINTLKKIVISLVFTLIVTFLCTNKMECVNAYLDDDGYVCLEMADHQRVNDIHYKTMGFTISRCVYNPCAKQLHNSLESVKANFSSIEPSSSSGLSGGVYYNTWRIHISELVAASPEWQEEVNKALSGEGPAVYIRYDSRLIVFKDEAETQIISGIADAPYFSNYADIDGANPNEILNCGPGWGGNTQREFAQHYNRYLLIGKIKEPDIPDLTEDEFISAERSPLEFWTGNFSNEWDLYNKNNPYSGIPSGETISRNDVIASRWYGETEVYARTKTSNKYANIPYRYWYTVWWMEPIYEDQTVGYKDDGTPITDSVHVRDEKRTEVVEVDSGNFYYNKYDRSDKTIMVPAVAYEYLYNASFYELANIDVYNNAFSGFLNYNGADVPMTCYSTDKYEDIATGSRIEKVQWLPDDNKHITWAGVPAGVDRDIFGGEIYIGDPRVSQAYEIMKSLYISDRKSIQDEIYSNTKTKNDSLAIDGVTYLKGEGVDGYEPSIGVNWLTTDMTKNEKEIPHTFCTESSSMKAPFEVGSISGASINTVNDSTYDIPIPEETDNGKYPTAMKVTFTRKVKNDGSLAKFTAGKDDFLTSVNNIDGKGTSMRGAAGFNALFNGSVNCGPLDGCNHSGLSAYTHLTSGSVVFGEVKGHCLDSYGGIIFVHTPVISPFSIRSDTWDPNTNNTEDMPYGQLDVSEYRSDATQLLLDNYYVLEWTQTDHVDRKGYGPSSAYLDEEYSKYDKYTLNKYVKFPFEVEYLGKYYPKDTWILTKEPSSYLSSSNYKPASSSNSFMPSSDNHWRKLVFYIPSYAIECGGLTDKECYIKTLVEATNVDGRFFEDHNTDELWIQKEDGFSPDGWENAWEERANILTEDSYSPEGARYATIYEDKVQLSGIIYDFMIVGSDDDLTFKYEDTGDHITGTVVPFCTYKEEKRVGPYNRYGLEDTEYGLYSAVRYRADGEIAKDSSGLPYWDPVNTLALLPGKSNCWNNMGYLIKGTTFSFSFKTIANLGDSTKDYAEIKPSFRYYSPTTGQMSDNIRLYYKSKVRDNVMHFVEFNPDADTSRSMRDWKDTNRRIFKLRDKQFEMSYYNYRNTSLTPIKYQIGDWITPTVKRYNKLRNLTGSDAFTAEEYMNKDNTSYCLSNIHLASDTLMLSGEWEQLGRNTRGLGREYENLLTYAMVDDSWSGASAGEKWTYSKPQQEKFTASMQTWFGQYFVPSDLWIVDLDNPNTRQIITDAGLDPDNFDLIEYMETKPHGIRIDDEIFEPDLGYLVINFDIRTYNSVDEKPATPHLKYYGGYSGSMDMWQQEGFNDDAGPNIPDTIKLKSGDVAIIDLNQSIKDRYKAGIFNIN